MSANGAATAKEARITRMDAPGVSVLIAQRSQGAAAAASEKIAAYLQSAGLTHEISVLEGDYATALRRGVGDARGTVVVIIDAESAPPLASIGDVIATIGAGAADVIFGISDAHAVPGPLCEWLLVSHLPDARCVFKAFSSAAAKLLCGETKLAGGVIDIEIAYLANKYGFRTEHVAAGPTAVPARWSAIGAVVAAFRIRFTDRAIQYRAARRCPVCFSSEVWSCAQIPGNVIRECNRCKCQYLNRFVDEDGGGEPVLRAPQHLAPAELPHDSAAAAPARLKTSLRRLAFVKKSLPPRSRLLEVGIRDASFAIAAQDDYEYVGIDRAPGAARHARARGLEVYCATLANFVNSGPPFDAIALFHVFENMPDPHDAMGRLKELIKPGGMLFLSTFDTEGLLYLMTSRSRFAQNFRTHLILYSRSALIELLEHSGFEILSVGPDLEYRDHKFLRHWISTRWPALAQPSLALLRILPDPLPISSGSIRIVAKRRSGSHFNMRSIRSAEPTHVR